jgi:uncharacterized protein
VKLIFADTFYWVALANPRDHSHSRVVRFVRQQENGIIVTTDEVLSEFLTYCASDTQLRNSAWMTAQQLLVASDTRVIPQTHASFLAGLELYRARPDKRYSLTDCISMQTMRRESIVEVLTNDRHFQQEGFQALFRE